jgi:hypothetical protein
MAHDDGSQYDIKAAWDQDRLILDLERHLSLAESAEGDERDDHRDAAWRINEDLRKLHGIDLLG